MIEIVLLVMGVVGFITLLIYSKFKSLKDSKKFIEKLYNNNVDLEYKEIDKFVKSSYKFKHPDSYIDDITFNDLSLGKIFSRMNFTVSKLGEQTLYRRLRSLDALDTVKFEKDIESFSNQSVRESYILPLVSIGKRDEYGYESIYDSLDLIKQKDRLLLNFMRFLAILGPIMLLIRIEIGIILIVFTVIVNLLLNERFNSQINAHLPLASDKIEIIKVARKIVSKSDLNFMNEKARLNESLGHFTVSKHMFGFVVPSSKTFDAAGLNTVSHLISAYFLVVPLAYNAIAKVFNDYEESFKIIMHTLGYLDSVFSIACYRNSLSNWSHPQFHASNTLSFENLVHPLLEEKGIANSLTLGNSTLITGSNASGKSTFVRAVALNSLLAQSFNMVCASSMTLPYLNIMTSMSLVDDIGSGDSYFVTETKSIKRIIDMINENRPTLICIDEVLKGTNTLERVAASASLLSYLSTKNCIVIAATHDLELTEILKHSHLNYHFSERVDEDGVSFDYLIKEGVSNKTNAINLLESFGYDQTLVAQARKFVKEYQSSKQWPVL